MDNTNSSNTVPTDEEVINQTITTLENALKEIQHLRRVIAGLKGYNHSLKTANELLMKSTKRKDEELERKSEMLKEANKNNKVLVKEITRLEEKEASISFYNRFKSTITSYFNNK